MPIDRQELQRMGEADRAYRHLFYTLLAAERRGERLRLTAKQHEAYMVAKVAREAWLDAMELRKEGIG